MKEHHTDEVLHVIDGWLNEFESAGNSDRAFKINMLFALSDFQIQLSNHIIQCEIIDSEFTAVLGHITDWFFENYVNMIDEIAEAAAVNAGEIQQYLSDISQEIDKLIEAFDSEDGDPDDERVYRAELFADLSSIHAMFAGDDFIALRIDENEARLNELTEVIILIEEESIIDSERLAVIYDMIGLLFEEYIDTDQTATLDADNILEKINTLLVMQRIWFEVHYSWLIDEIADMDAEDEYDGETVKNKIGGLELVKQFVEDDGVVSTEFLHSINEQIERLIEDYESDLVLIAERIKQRDAEEAARIAAANRNNARTPASTSNNRTGTSNTNTSSNNTSSNTSSNNTSGSSSGTGSSNTSGSGSGSATVTDNRYPSITSNCREMLARLVRLEAPNDGADGKQAVAEVVLNRMVSSRWSHANTVAEVINDDKWGVQFTVKDIIWTERGNPASSDYAAVDRALSGSNILGREYVFFNTRPVTQIDVIWIGSHAFSK